MDRLWEPHPLVTRALCIQWFYIEKKSANRFIELSKIWVTFLYVIKRFNKNAFKSWLSKKEFNCRCNRLADGHLFSRLVKLFFRKKKFDPILFPLFLPLFNFFSPSLFKTIFCMKKCLQIVTFKAKELW